MDLALNNLQRLICHKTQTNQPAIQDFELTTNVCIADVKKKFGKSEETRTK